VIKVDDIQSAIPPDLVAGLSQNQIDELMANIGNAARSEWIRLASQDRSSFRYDYIQGIMPVETYPGAAVIALVGDVAHMLEDGYPRRVDLRDILLGQDVPLARAGGRGKKQNAEGGFYRSIPFRHTTPGSVEAPRGKTAGQEMGSFYRGNDTVPDAKKLGRAIHRKAKALKPYGNPYGESGVKPKEMRLPEGLAPVGANPETGTPHKTDIYAGMIRQEKVYDKATQSTYTTFRTISTSVRDESWIRSPITARHYAEKVSAYVQKIAGEAVAALLEEA
jgi:hypothetical protein